MSTAAAVNRPASPGKPLRGQARLAAKIVRWLALSENLAAELDQLPPPFQDLFTQFRAMLADAQALYERFAVLQAETAAALAERKAVMAEGAELFSRLRLGLQAVYGPESPRLRQFGLKPRGKRGRKKAAPPVPLAPEPQGVSR